MNRSPGESTSKVVAGDLDLSYNIDCVKEYVNDGGMKKDVPLLGDVVILLGVAHFPQEEKPDVKILKLYSSHLHFEHRNYIYFTLVSKVPFS